MEGRVPLYGKGGALRTANVLSALLRVNVVIRFLEVSSPSTGIRLEDQNGRKRCMHCRGGNTITLRPNRAGPLNDGSQEKAR
jgi:hypothetical protein